MPFFHHGSTHDCIMLPNSQHITPPLLPQHSPERKARQTEHVSPNTAKSNNSRMLQWIWLTDLLIPYTSPLRVNSLILNCNLLLSVNRGIQIRNWTSAEKYLDLNLKHGRPFCSLAKPSSIQTIHPLVQVLPVRSYTTYLYLNSILVLFKVRNTKMVSIFNETY